MEYLNSILPAIKHFGVWSYWIVFIFSLTEALVFVGWVVPGGTLVVLAGLLAAQGYLNLWVLVCFASIGAILGDSLSFWIGSKGTNLFNNENKILKLNHLDKGIEFFKKHGGKSIFLGRFFAPVRPVVPFVAGLSKMNKIAFLLWNVSSGIFWAISHLFVGYFFGNALHVIEAWSTRAGIFILALVLAIIIIKFAIKYLNSFLLFLKSSIVSLKLTLLSVPGIKGFITKHPKLICFVQNRFDVNRFSGLTLTCLIVAFVYAFFLFAGIAEAIITSGPIVELDIRVANLLYIFRDAELLHFFLWVTLLGKWQVIAGSVIVTSAILWLWRENLYISPLLLSVMGSSIIFSIGKTLFHRPRPKLAYYLEQSFSFPSGHAAMAVAFYGFLAYILLCLVKSWKMKANILFVSLIIIVFIGLSRLYLGVHFLSDVLGGYLLGVLWLIVGISISQWLNRRYSISASVLRWKAVILSLILITANLCVYVCYGIEYTPQHLIRTEEQKIVVNENILDAFYSKKLPQFTEKLNGDKQQPINFIFTVKDQNQLINDMGKAGWQLADRIDVFPMLHMTKSVLLNEHYPNAPITPSFWNNQVNDLGFEKPTENKTVRERHLARFWKTDLITNDGKQIYVGAVYSYKGLKWLIIPRKNSDIDAEREMVFSDLQKADLISSFQKVQLVCPILREKSKNNRFFTDGKTYIIFLR